MLRIQRRRGFHYDDNDFGRRNNFERGRLPPAVRKHVLDAGKSFFSLIRFNHYEIDNRPTFNATLFNIEHRIR